MIIGTKTIDATSRLVLEPDAREWCKLPYPGHPKGCPNYGEKDHCPPNAPWIEDWIDLCKPHWIIVCIFDLGHFELRMKKRHPDWSERQCRCVLYWQNTVKKRLRERCEENVRLRPGAVYTLLPEAMGVNVIVTAMQLGIPIQPKPDGRVYKIALMGYPHKEIERHHDTRDLDWTIQSVLTDFKKEEN